MEKVIESYEILQIFWCGEAWDIAALGRRPLRAPRAAYTGRCLGGFWMSLERTTSLSSLLQCSSTLCVEFFLMLRWNSLCFSSRPLLLLLSLCTTSLPQAGSPSIPMRSLPHPRHKLCFPWLQWHSCQPHPLGLSRPLWTAALPLSGMIALLINGN